MPSSARSLLVRLLLVACLGSAPPLCAQSTTASGDEEDGSVFGNDYFIANAPANAYDMVVRLPGFSIIEADAEIRGYAASQGNVLIDGARPTSKREDITQLLKRIPADSVARIELIRRASGQFDMAGHVILANVVRRHGVAIDAAVELGLVASTDGWVQPQTALEYAREWSEHSFEFAAKFEPELDDDTGHGTIRAVAPNGNPISVEMLDIAATNKISEATGVWRQPLAGGRLALNTALRGERVRTDTDIEAQAAAGEAEAIRENEDYNELELGLHFERDFGDRFKLDAVASQQLGWLQVRERSREGDGVEAFDEDTTTGETIARVEWNFERSKILSLAATLEGAFNFLKSDARLAEDGVTVDLPGSDVNIEEQRVEGAVTASWIPADRWLLEASLRVEHSAISQRGDSPLERSFVYPKPRIALRWDVDGRSRLRLSVSREVGQLEFADFVASASLDTGVVTAGNARLEPDKTWRTTAAWEHRFRDDTTLTLSLTHDRISDVVDRILVIAPDDAFDAPGNIGDGRRETLALDFSTPLDRFGVAGGHLRSTLLWRRSRVTDPVTGERRPISEENPVDGQIAFTQDLPAMRLNWGVELDHIAERESKYRFDEVVHEAEDAGWTLFVERRIGKRWRLRAEGTDLFGRDFTERREQYDGARSAVPLEQVEHRNRETPGYFSLTLRREMGG